MGRRPAFDRASIARATLELVSEGGPRAATIGAIAARLGAPTGSIYHRYPSRELLLAELWLSVVERFNVGFLAVLAGADAKEAGPAAARFWASWTREHPIEARVFLLHRHEDFVPGEWPDAVHERAQRALAAMADGLRAYTRRRFGGASAANLRRVRFAVIDVPQGTLKRYVQAAKPPPAQIDELIDTAVRSVLDAQERGLRRA